MSTFAESVKGWLEAGLAFFYPPTCQICGNARTTPAEGFVCGGCRGKTRFIVRPFCERCGRPYEGAITGQFECGSCADTELHFSSARSAVAARDVVLEVIHRYKYQRALWFEVFLADLLVHQAKPELARERWDAIVPMPLHPTKEREREFNQAERLARRLSRATGIPVNKRLVRRVVATRTQTRLNRQERLANVRNAFAMRNGDGLDGARIVLVDDVFTTGATSSACARALRAGGAGEVCVWTVARGI
jgi:competence protein ComFC